MRSIASSEFSNRLLATTGLLLGALLHAAQAQEAPLPQNCFDLWKERNQYYADAHYCFKTQKAKNEFKEAMKTCSVDDESRLRLSEEQLRRIAKIIQRERAYGCSSN